MERMDFWKSLEGMDDAAAVQALLSHFSVWYAAVKGLDGLPDAYPVEFLFEEDGAFWFAADKSTRYYAEISLSPQIVLCAFEQETRTVVSVSGNAVFSEDEALRDRCLQESEGLREIYGKRPEYLLPYCLLGIRAKILPAREEITAKTYVIADSAAVLTGPVLKKDTALRDRLKKILEEREAEGSFAETDAKMSGETASEYTKFRDGALFLFAEAAKELWPRMDIRPIERAAVFTTYDEREKYTLMAKKKIGNASVTKPEDLSYWLSEETLRMLLEG